MKKRKDFFYSFLVIILVRFIADNYLFYNTTEPGTTATPPFRTVCGVHHVIVNIAQIIFSYLRQVTKNEIIFDVQR